MNKKKNHIWPESETPCIWMEASVVDFKLCDFNNNCENCPFDAIMRNKAAQHGTMQGPYDKNLQVDKGINQQFNPTAKIVIEEHIYYGEKHWYFERLSENKILAGFDQVTLSMLPALTDIIISEEQQIKKGQAVCWLVSESGTMCLPAPVSGKIIKVNNSFLNDRKTDKTRIWLFVLETENLQNELAKFKQGEQATKYLQTNQGAYFALFKREMDQAQLNLGATLPDGGNPIQSLEQLFGAKKYWTLIYNYIQQCKNVKLQ